jgi:hypothetical protein
MQVWTFGCISKYFTHIDAVGLYYVIDGLLDVSMPAEGSEFTEELDRKCWAEKYRTKPQEKKKSPVKHLFTVSPGGIAGYLGWYKAP